MKKILQELKGSMSGVIGSFIVGKNGEVAAQDVPELMAGRIDKVSITLHHVLNVIKATKSVDKLTVDSESAKLISIPTENKMLVIITEKSINLPLFKLMSNMAISKVKDAPLPPPKPEAPAYDAGAICDLYDQLFGAAAKRLANIIGPKSAVHFNEGAASVKSSYPKLFADLNFGSSGKPDMTKIRDRAKKVSSKDELVDALDEMLLSMLDSVKKIAGAKQEQKAMDDIQKIKSEKSDLL